MNRPGTNMKAYLHIIIGAAITLALIALFTMPPAGHGEVSALPWLSSDFR